MIVKVIGDTIISNATGSVPPRQKNLYEAGLNDNQSHVQKYFDDYVEDVLSYICGIIDREFNIVDIKTSNDGNSQINVYESKNNKPFILSNDDMSFVASITSQKVLSGKPLTEKQYGRLVKIFRNNETQLKEYISDDMYKVVLSNNLFLDIVPSVSYERCISFIGAGFAGIQFNYNIEIINIIKQIKGVSYIGKHKLWLVPVSTHSKSVIFKLKNKYNFKFDLKMELLLKYDENDDTDSKMCVDYDIDNTIFYGTSCIASMYDIALAMNGQ